MKCKCLIPKNKARGWKKNVLSVGEMSPKEIENWFKWNQEHNDFHFDLKDYESCGGNLMAHVEATDEPDWGGHYAELQVYFECDFCGCVVHKYLPDKYTIENFLTNTVKEMP